MMRRVVRRMAWKVAPGRMSDRARRFEQQFRVSHRIPDSARLVVGAHGDRVTRGPFEGLRYPLELLTQADAPVAKLVGSYENEIYPALQRLLPDASCFIDFGCADGYFAVGAARYGKPVYAFDVATSSRRATAALAEANGVTVTLGGRASVRGLPLDRALILCDIDGAEGDIFDDDAVRALRSASLIVELHDEHLRPGVTDLLRERFSASHRVAIIPIARRDLAEFPELDVVPAGDKGAAMSEQRSNSVTWGVFEPLASADLDG